MASRTATRSGRPPAKKDARPPARGRRRTEQRSRPRAAAPLWHGPAGLLAVVGLLCLIGLMMVLSASAVHALREYGSSWYFFQRQLAYIGLGAVALVAAARLDYRNWQRLATPMLAVCTALLVLVLIPGVGITVSGSARWLGVGPVQFQPSEMTKLALAAFGATLLAKRSDQVDQVGRTMWPVLWVFGGFGLLTMLQPDMGTTLVLAASTFTMLYAAGLPLRSLATTGVLGAALVFVLGWIEPYRRARLTAFLDPWADASNTGYQVTQSLAALGSGHLWGVGLGESRAKWGFLPNAHTDFILAIIGDEAGLVGTLLVVALFGGFATIGVRTALRAPDRFGALLAIGITGWIVSQAVINMGAVVQLLPVTGVPMPFVSYGGSSLVIVMAATGVLINIARQAR